MEALTLHTHPSRSFFIPPSSKIHPCPQDTLLSRTRANTAVTSPVWEWDSIFMNPPVGASWRPNPLPPKLRFLSKNLRLRTFLLDLLSLTLQFQGEPFSKVLTLISEEAHLLQSSEFVSLLHSSACFKFGECVSWGRRYRPWRG